MFVLSDPNLPIVFVFIDFPTILNLKNFCGKIQKNVSIYMKVKLQGEKNDGEKNDAD